MNYGIFRVALSPIDQFNRIIFLKWDWKIFIAIFRVNKLLLLLFYWLHIFIIAPD